MLRPLFTTSQPNGAYGVDPTAEFQPGMIGGLVETGGEILMTVSDGVTIQPYGIIDDIRTRAFKQPAVSEQVIIPATADAYGESTTDVNGYLQNTNVDQNTFTADISIILIPINGVITVPAGTPLNYDSTGDNIYDSFLVTCSYYYQVPGVPGDDTTIGSGQVSIWFSRGEYSTDQYDTTVPYALNATLYCGSDGKLTTRPNGPGLAMVTGPPHALYNELTFLWF